MNKKMIWFVYNRHNFASILLIGIFILMGCTLFRATLVTPIVKVASITETPLGIVITISPLPTITQNTISSSSIPSTTPVSSIITSSISTTSTVTPIAIPEVSEIITPYSTGTFAFKHISVSDPNWSAIIRQIDGLQGFYTLSLSPDGKLLAGVESNDNFSRVYLWDITTGNMKWIVSSDELIGTTKLIFSPDGTLLATGTDSIVQNVFVWDATNGNQLHKFLYQDYTTDMNFSPDNKLLAISGIFPGEVIVWNLEDKSVIELDTGNAVDFMPNSSFPLIAVAKGWRLQNETSPVYLLNLQNGQMDYLFPDSFFAQGIAFSLDGHLLATVITNEEGQSMLRVLNLQNNEEILAEENELSMTQTEQITFSPQGYIAVLHGDLTLWNADGHLLGSLDGQNIKEFIFTPDGYFLLTYSGFDTSLEVWELPPS